MTYEQPVSCMPVPVADGHVRNALAELVDNARRLVAHGLRELLVHQAPKRAAFIIRR